MEVDKPIDAWLCWLSARQAVYIIKSWVFEFAKAVFACLVQSFCCSSLSHWAGSVCVESSCSRRRLREQRRGLWEREGCPLPSPVPIAPKCPAWSTKSQVPCEQHCASQEPPRTGVQHPPHSVWGTCRTWGLQTQHLGLNDQSQWAQQQCNHCKNRAGRKQLLLSITLFSRWDEICHPGNEDSVLSLGPAAAVAGVCPGPRCRGCLCIQLWMPLHSDCWIKFPGLLPCSLNESELKLPQEEPRWFVKGKDCLAGLQLSLPWPRASPRDLWQEAQHTQPFLLAAGRCQQWPWVAAWMQPWLWAPGSQTLIVQLQWEESKISRWG